MYDHISVSKPQILMCIVTARLPQSLESIWDDKSPFSVLPRVNGSSRSADPQRVVSSSRVSPYLPSPQQTAARQQISNTNHSGVRTLQDIEAEMRAIALASRGQSQEDPQVQQQQAQSQAHQHHLHQQQLIQQQQLLQQQQIQQQQLHQRTPPPRMLPQSQSPRFHLHQQQILLMQQQQDRQQQHRLRELQDQLRLEEIERQLRTQQ